MSSEHLIRLRGGWEWQASEAGSEVGRRIALPTVWPPGLSAPIRLVRRFGGPPVDPQREQVVLRLENVPGLRSVWLNDRLLGQLTQNADALEFVVDEPLPARNLLRLLVDPTAWSDLEAISVPWGTIALAIRPR
jgi:hypothetical protein